MNENEEPEIIDGQMTDMVVQPDGVKLYFPQGVDEFAFETKRFPLGSRLFKKNGKKYRYCHIIGGRERCATS